MRRATAALALGIGALVAAACSFGASDATSDFDRIAIQSLWLEGLLALFAFAGASLLPGRPAARLGLGPGRLGAAQVAVLAIGTLGASAALDGILDLTQWKAHSGLGEFEAMLSGVRGRSLLLSLIAFALMPGIAEELLCRGLLQRSLVARTSPAAGIALASIAFGALHLDPVHALFAAPLGLYLGLVCWLAASVRASIACHIANNLSALLTGALLTTSGPPAWPMVGLGAAVAIAALAWVWRRVGPPEPESVDPGSPERPDAPPTAPGNPL